MLVTLSQFCRHLFLALILVALVPLPATIISAQDDEGVDTDSLLEIDLDAGALPAPPAFIRLVRITLDPGATSPEHTHPGPEFGRVESGVVTVKVSGPAKLKQRSAKAEDPFEDVEQGKETNLERGDRIYYPAGTPLTFTNEGEEQAQLLALVILPAEADRPELIDYTGGFPTEDQLQGVNSKILGDGIMTAVPSGKARITIRRVKLSEGQSLPGSRNPVLYSVVEGPCEFTVTGGSVQVSRSRTPGPQLDLELDEEVRLRAGDAVFLPNGIRTTGRGENSDDLELLQVIIAPNGNERLAGENRGQINFKKPQNPPEPDEEDQTDTASAPSSTGWQEGDTVYVNSTDVNLRDSPSINGALVTVLLYGQELTVDGEPTEADGIVWWPVHVTADASLAGYVTQEFIQTEPVE
jgi:quercetin dioxygenase-like cupin family protein